MSREQQLADAIVGLADSFADDVDPVALFERLALSCVEITGADAAGIMVADVRGGLRTMAVTSDRAALVELFELQTEEGPCVDCYRKGERIDTTDLEQSTARWPQLAPFAVDGGYRGSHALPLRVQRQTIGAVNLLLNPPGGLPGLDLDLAQALADVTAVALANWNPYPVEPRDVSTRVQAAITAKATVEIAVGMIAEYGGLTLSDAYATLRAYADRTGHRVAFVAHALVQRALPLEAVAPLPG